MTLCELPTRWLDKLASYSRIPIQWQETCSNRIDFIRIELWKTFLERRPCGPVSGVVHTRVEVRRMDSEMSGLMERPWLQLICCAVCLPRGRNFRWRRESLSGSEYWLVCRHWTPEIEFNKRLSSSIIRLANYSVITSLIYKLIL